MVQELISAAEVLSSPDSHGSTHMLVCTSAAMDCVITCMVAAQHAKVFFKNCNMHFDLKWLNQNAALYKQLTFPTSPSPWHM